MKKRYAIYLWDEQLDYLKSGMEHAMKLAVEQGNPKQIQFAAALLDLLSNPKEVHFKNQARSFRQIAKDQLTGK